MSNFSTSMGPERARPSLGAALSVVLVAGCMGLVGGWAPAATRIAAQAPTPCAVTNGNMERLTGEQQPEFWTMTTDVRSVARAHAGRYGVTFNGVVSRLAQRLRVERAGATDAELVFWAKRPDTLPSFALTMKLGSVTLPLTLTQSSLPAGVWTVFKVRVPAEAMVAGELDLTFFHSRTTSPGTLDLDDVSLDLCLVPAPTATSGGDLPTVTPTGGETTTPVDASPTPTGTQSTATTPPEGTGTLEPGVTPMETPLLTPRSTLEATPTGTLEATPVVTLTAVASETPPGDGTGTPESTATPTDSPTPTSTRTPTMRPEPESLYLPWLAKKADLPMPRPRSWGMQFGLDDDVPALHKENVRVELPRGRAMDPRLTLVRTNLRWDRVEPQNTTPDGFNWAEADGRIADYSKGGYDVIVTLLAYPKWATKYQCGYALNAGMEKEWREFVREAVKRYSQPPYRIAAYEIGNEVDGKTTVTDDDRKRPEGWGRGEPTVPIGGCWGDRPVEYKAFLRMAYEEVRAVDARTPVTIGGLAYVYFGPQETELFLISFLDKFLAAGGGDYMDFLGIHWFPNVLQPPDYTGPNKFRRILATLDKYGQRQKGIWLTETYRGMWRQLPNSWQDQVGFLTKELVEVLQFPEISRIVWYGYVDFPPDYGHQTDPNRGIIRYDHTPKQAFTILPFTMAYTNGSPEDISTAAVQAYRFQPPRAAETYVIAWSRDKATHTLAIPARFGQSAKVTSFPVGMLAGGKCCQVVRVGAKGDVYEISVGPDSVFVKIE